MTTEQIIERAVSAGVASVWPDPEELELEYSGTVRAVRSACRTAVETALSDLARRPE